MEVQGSADGRVYFRVLDRHHRTGYDPHKDASWSIQASPTSAAAVQKTVEAYAANFKKEQEAGRERVRRYNEEKAKQDAQKAQQAAAAKKAELAEKRAKVQALQGPKPESIKLKYPASTAPSYRCTSCKEVDSGMMSESLREGYDGYSPCCNEPIMSTEEKLPPTYETTFSSREDSLAFVKANKIPSYMLYQEAGKHKVSSSLPGFSE